VTTTTAATAAAVRIVEPAADARVTSPVAVKMVADNFVIEAAGLAEPGHGHFHLMIDVPCVTPGEVVPRDDQHRHLGNGETEATLTLPPGEHVICLQAGDGLHRALPLMDRRTFTVVASPAAAVVSAAETGAVRKVAGSY
jgi:hypothetical protein